MKTLKNIKIAKLLDDYSYFELFTSYLHVQQIIAPKIVILLFEMSRVQISIS